MQSLLIEHSGVGGAFDDPPHPAKIAAAAAQKLRRPRRPVSTAQNYHARRGVSKSYLSFGETETRSFGMNDSAAL